MHSKITEETVYLPGPQGKLEAKLWSAGVGLATGRIGIICHPHPLYQGTMENKVVTTIARAWQEMEIATIRFNFRGVGKSEGEYGKGIGEQEDLSAVLEWAEQWAEQAANKQGRKKEQKSSIYLAGFSFGSYVSAAVAALNRYPIRFLLSIAPPVQHFAFAEFSLKTLPACPWLVIQGDQDEIVAFDWVKNWVNELQARKSDLKLEVISGATHFFHGQLLDLKAIVKEHTSEF